MSTAKYQTRTWHVYNDLLRLISEGAFKLGSRLDEQRIAEELGVSRTPLREAITQLVRDGIVENRPYRGNFVRRFTAEQVFDLYDVRKVLEAAAVRLAVPKLTDASIAKLRAILDEINSSLEAGDLEAYGLADREFHETIARISGNETLITTLNRLAGQIQLVRTMANRSPDVVEITAMERPEIVEAMANRNVELAASLMEEHIEMVQRSITTIITTGDSVDAEERVLASREVG